MDKHPIEILHKIGFNLSVKGLKTYGRLSPKFERICNDNYFWIKKAGYEFSLTTEEVLSFDLEPLSGKERYIQLATRAGAVCRGSEKYKSVHELAKRAVKLGDIELVHYFIGQCYDAEARECMLKKILEGALEMGSLYFVNYVYATKIRQSAWDLEHNIYIAAEYGHTYLVRVLLKFFTDKNKMTDRDFGSIFERIIRDAAKGNKMNVISFMLKEYPINIVKANIDGLIGSADGGHFELFKWFINWNKGLIDIQNDPTLDKSYLLDCASTGGNSDIIRYILNNIISLDSLNQDDLTYSLQSACCNGDTELIDLFLKKAVEKNMDIDYVSLLRAGYEGAQPEVINRFKELLLKETLLKEALSKGTPNEDKLLEDFESNIGVLLNSFRDEYPHRKYKMNQVQRIGLIKTILEDNPTLDPKGSLLPYDPSDDIYANRIVIESPTAKWADYTKVAELKHILKMYGPNVYDSVYPYLSKYIDL